MALLRRPASTPFMFVALSYKQTRSGPDQKPPVSLTVLSNLFSLCAIGKLENGKASAMSNVSDDVETGRSCREIAVVIFGYLLPFNAIFHFRFNGGHLHFRQNETI